MRARIGSSESVSVSSAVSSARLDAARSSASSASGVGHGLVVLDDRLRRHASGASAPVAPAPARAPRPRRAGAPPRAPCASRLEAVAVVEREQRRHVDLARAPARRTRASRGRGRVRSQSVTTVTRRRPCGSQSSALRRFSPTTPLIVGAAAITPSSEPCSAIHFAAVFGPDLVDAGHVVDRVADQRQVVDDALGRHAELGQHAGDVERLVAHRVDQRHVARRRAAPGPCRRWRSTTLKPPLAAMHARRADRVVGLDAGHRRAPASRAACTTSWIGSICSARSSGIDVRWPCTRGTSRRGRSCPWRRTRRPRAPPGTARAAASSSTTMPWIAPVGTPPGPRRSGSAW